MSRLKALSRSRVIRILTSNGFAKARSAKHATYKRTRNNETLTTWVPHHATVTAFVISYIIKQTKKPREEFL